RDCYAHPHSPVESEWLHGMRLPHAGALPTSAKQCQDCCAPQASPDQALPPFEAQLRRPSFCSVPDRSAPIRARLSDYLPVSTPPLTRRKASNAAAPIQASANPVLIADSVAQPPDIAAAPSRDRHCSAKPQPTQSRIPPAPADNARSH